jgi:hypothetical protein
LHYETGNIYTLVLVDITVMLKNQLEVWKLSDEAVVPRLNFWSIKYIKKR